MTLDAKHSKLRDGLPRLAARLLRGEAVTVAYLGGSITEGAGASVGDETSWRALNGRFLAERYAGAAWSFINAGVGGTTSTFGAHRLQAHALNRGAVDLLLVEFAVNDGDDREESIRGMEGIVRQCRRLSPQTELIFLYTAADKNLSAEGLPFNIAVHEEVAAHYGIASLNLAGGVQDLIAAGKTSWEALAPDRVHPNDEGHALYAACVNAFIAQAVEAAADSGAAEERAANPAPSELTNIAVSASASAAGVGGHSEEPTMLPSELPPPLAADNYEFAAMADAGPAAISEARSEGFEPAALGADDPLMNWRFGTGHLAASGSSGERLAFAVEGNRAGVVLLHGPDSGIFEYSLDGGERFTPVNVFDEWCPLAYRPIPVVFPAQSGSGQQPVIIRCTGTKDERSRGTGIRILKLLSS